VLAGSDLLGIGLVRGLTDAGVRVPDELSVAGFDNLVHAGVCDPPLTTVAALPHTMGTEAFAELRRQLHGDPPRPRSLPARLVVRQSTSPVALRTSPIALLKGPS
jgi:LacI family transcriptional regulator